MFPYLALHNTLTVPYLPSLELCQLPRSPNLPYQSLSTLPLTLSSLSKSMPTLSLTLCLSLSQSPLTLSLTLGSPLDLCPLSLSLTLSLWCKVGGCSHQILMIIVCCYCCFCCCGLLFARCSSLLLSLSLSLSLSLLFVHLFVSRSSYLYDAKSVAGATESWWLSHVVIVCCLFVVLRCRCRCCSFVCSSSQSLSTLPRSPYVSDAKLVAVATESWWLSFHFYETSDWGRGAPANAR